MKIITILLIAVFSIFIFIIHRNNQKSFPVLKSPYLDQKVRGILFEIFTPGIISTELEESVCTFSFNNRKFYFSQTIMDNLLNHKKMIIIVGCLSNNNWSKPEFAHF
jgi:hypothetical protein